MTSNDELERLVMARVVAALKRRRGCIPTPAMLAELSQLATDVANATLVELGAADRRPARVAVTVDQPERREAIVLGVRLGVARVTLELAAPADVDGLDWR